MPLKSKLEEQNRQCNARQLRQGILSVSLQTAAYIYLLAYSLVISDKR